MSKFLKQSNYLSEVNPCAHPENLLQMLEIMQSATDKFVSYEDVAKQLHNFLSENYPEASENEIRVMVSTILTTPLYEDDGKLINSKLMPEVFFKIQKALINMIKDAAEWFATTGSARYVVASMCKEFVSHNYDYALVFGQGSVDNIADAAVDMVVKIWNEARTVHATDDCLFEIETLKRLQDYTVLNGLLNTIAWTYNDKYGANYMNQINRILNLHRDSDLLKCTKAVIKAYDQMQQFSNVSHKSNDVNLEDYEDFTVKFQYMDDEFDALEWVESELY